MFRLAACLSIVVASFFAPSAASAQAVSTVTTVSIDVAKIPEYAAAVVKIEPIIQKYAPNAKLPV